jgi:murein DD-endopeptidase MepM/ murein hydrolase activator NlpD
MSIEKTAVQSQIKRATHRANSLSCEQKGKRRLQAGLCLLLSFVLALTLGGFGAFAQPQVAWAATSAEKKAEADAAISKLDKLQTEINAVEKRYIEAEKARTEAEIKRDAAKKREEAAKKRIAELQEQLGDRANYMYRNGNVSFLDVIFGAKSFIEFIEVMDLVDRINTQDAELVVASKAAKAEAETARIEFTEQEKVAREKAEEIAELLKNKEASAANMRTEISKLKKEIIKLQAQEEAAAAAAKALRDAEVASGGYGNTTISPETKAKVPKFVHPVPGAPFTSGFGWRPSTGSYHLGADYACPTGTNIKAAAAGTVIITTYGSSTGNMVVISHGNGVVTKYMHASSFKVKAGQTVKQGQVIMLSGNTGNSTGPHLHFQVEVDGVAYNPLLFL